MALSAACASEPGQGGGGQGAASTDADTLSLSERRGIPGWIVFISEQSGNQDVYRIRPTGEWEPLVVGPAAEYPAEASPDGSIVPVVQVEETDGAHLERLLLYRLVDGGTEPIGPTVGRVRNPSWSPDGRWLVLESDVASFRDVYRVDLAERSLQRLTDDREGNFDPAVAPDGKSIAFVSSRDGQTEIYRMNADGSDPRRLTAFHRDDVLPRWSPDGRWIAFVSDREGVDRIFLMAPDGTGQRRLNPGAGASADEREEDPVWSPDGSRIAHVVRSRAGGAAVWVTHLATGERARVAGPGSRNEMPAWSPDGRYLVYVSERDGDPELYLARADGSGATRLTRSPGADWLPRWVAAGDGERR